MLSERRVRTELAINARGAVQRYLAIKMRATRRCGVGKQGIAWIANNHLSQRKG
jgi:hypothetical protein